MQADPSQIIGDLPGPLAERTRVIDGAVHSRGEFVLYWLHHAMRAQDNPALDVAVSLSNRLHLPLLVYHAIPEDDQYASDRHHMFMLQGARDLEQQFHDRGLQFAFHLQRPGHRGFHLANLCNRAAVTITEEMPVEPTRGWIHRLANTTDTAVVCVDTACIVPMQLVGRAYDRAFQYRKATQSLYRERLARPWQDVQPEVRSASIDPAFEPLCLATSDLAELVSQCDIDHTVAPVPHTCGGSAAGYERWELFKWRDLPHYARRRNDPLLEGTSRLSPYLHYGMVSPLRIAWEALESAPSGSDKFLDELLIWRELAYCFCFYQPQHESLAALPAWARETLADGQTDPRPRIHSWETLARGRTGDPLWDAAQRSLLMHGELHNNVRMTWGKSLLNWTKNAETALAMMVDLNHRYALDGRDPASYGGILWCLGQFDRPFPPARPILGTVRDRSTKEHAKRLDINRYLAHTTRSLRSPQPRVAVVGAGISGLMCARTLADHGFDVAVFEKSRGAGGRMATRRTQEGPRFDHGAQYFTVRDPRFERYVESWIQDGIVQPWQGRIATLTGGQWQWKQEPPRRFVAVPAMNAICKHLAEDLQVRFQTHVVAPEKIEGDWRLTDASGHPLGKFDCFMTSAPAPQSATLLDAAPGLAQSAERTRMTGCWAAMLAFQQSLDLPFDAAFVHESPLAWIARNDTKPGRADETECWVLHASPEWTTRYIESDPEQVLALLIAALWEATGASPREPFYKAGHRWRYAIPPEPLEQRSLYDSQLQVGACGDWCSGPRVEGAFLSGMSIAGRVLTHLLT